jgi:hypothetical protein
MHLTLSTNYVFTFHDSTLECIVHEGKWWKPEISEFRTQDEANSYILKKRNGEPAAGGNAE